MQDRRRFLGEVAVCWSAACGGAACFPALGRAAAPLDHSMQGRIKKGVKYHMITDKISVMDKFRMLQELGFDGVEPRVSDPVDPKEILAASEATGVKIHGVLNSSNPDITTAIERAKFYGADSVLVVVPMDRQGSYLENYRTRQELIRQAIPAAEKNEVKILIENVWASFLNEPLSMARFIDELKSPWVGAYFDIGNNIRWGHAWQWIEVLGPRIKKLDVKEYSQKLHNEEGLRAGFNVEIGEGSVDWARVRQGLLSIDYSGWATAEVRGGDRERLHEIANRMNRVFEL